MTEQHVSFEVAKLLKELGWELPTNCLYFEDGEFKKTHNF